MNADAATTFSTTDTTSVPNPTLRPTGKRVVIVDPSLNSPHSHNLNYARVFIRDAKAAGYDVVLLANKGFGQTQVEGCEVRPVFRHTIYQHGAIIKDRLNPKWMRASRLIGRIRTSLNFRLSHQRDRLRNEGRTVESSYFDILRKGANFVSLLGGGLMVLASRLLLREDQPFNRDTFAVGLSDEIQRLKLGAGDMVVFHTASFGLLESLSEARLRLPGLVASEADAHFIFHMSPTAPDARTYLNRFHQFADPSTVRHRLKVGSPFTRLHFWATSDALREELEPLTKIDFRLWHDINDVSEAEARAVRDTVIARTPADQRVVVGVRASDMRVEVIEPLAQAMEDAGQDASLTILARGPVLTDAAALLKARVPGARIVDVSTSQGFLESIAGCDVMVLPYEREIYRRRISAVLGNCGILGVAVVAQQDTTLGHDVDHADVFTYDTIQDLRDATARAIVARSQRLASGQPRWPEAKPACAAYFRNVQDQLIAVSAGEPSLASPKTVKVAVTVAPLWGRCGSTRAFEAQFLVLNTLGYFVIQTFISRERFTGAGNYSHYFSMLRENSMGGRANVQRIALRSLGGTLSVLAQRGFWRTSAMGQLNGLHATADVRDPFAKRAMAAAELGVINHVYHLGFAHRRIGGRKVLDTHDIQSVHMHRNGAANFLTRRPETFDALYADELTLVRTADAIVNVSEDDDRTLRQHNPNSTHIYPWVPPIRLMPQFENPDAWARANGKGEWYEGFDDFDMFLAGDAHPANVESAMWFMEKVFIPYLQPKRLRLVLCGRLSDAIYARLNGTPHVFYASFVSDIDDVRALSKIAVLPDRGGAGISNKTIESLSRGMAFTATSFAMRGIEGKYDGEIPVFDDPRDFAADIISMCRFKRRLSERAELSEAIYQDLFAFEPILEKWKNALGVK